MEHPPYLALKGSLTFLNNIFRLDKMKRNISLILLTIFVFTILRFSMAGYSSVGFGGLILFDQVALVLGVVSAFAFWFMMLSDFFNNDSLRFKSIWGFCLFFFSWLSSLIYFFKHFLPRQKGSDREKIGK